MKTSDLTSKDCIAALRKRFPTSEYAFLEQVANSTGAGVRGWADAIALSLWPSRGIVLWGFEIKVSRADWKRELAKPKKSSEIQGYCDHWLVVAPPGVVELAEVPRNWGLLEVTSTEKSKFVKPAPPLKSKPFTKDFVAALLRRQSNALEQLLEAAAEAGRKAGAEGGHGELAARLKSTESSAQLLEERIQAFETASGVNIDGYHGAGKIGTAVKTILDASWRVKFADQLARDAKAHEQMAARCKRDLAEFLNGGGDAPEEAAE